ncbi:hypothetical protein LWI29_005261 [Acer saccharum]|uniref:Uncharacterized protein n=1 Tax=Acer saccharum TaxID=4024 RepID=A0AA39VHT0_ACESA|nr:hypothetical protein LWI29_005261 [Acer saccharum]
MADELDHLSEEFLEWIDISVYLMTCLPTSVKLTAMTCHVSHSTLTCSEMSANRRDVLTHVSKVGDVLLRRKSRTAILRRRKPQTRRRRRRRTRRSRKRNIGDVFLLHSRPQPPLLSMRLASSIWVP